MLSSDILLVNLGQLHYSKCMNHDKASVTQSFTHAIVQQLSAAEVKLAPELEQQLARYDGQQRLPLALQDELWQSLELLQQPQLGLTIGLALQPQHFDTIGFLLLSSPSLSTAVESLVTFSSLVGEGGAFTKRKVTDGWQLTYHDKFKVAVALRIEAIFASIAHGATWVAGKPITPVRVTFKHKPQVTPELYQQAFGAAELSFAQPDNAIVFSDSDWQFRQREVSPALQAQMLTLAQQQLAQLQAQSYREQCEALLQRQPWLSRAQVAATLAVSERTLARYLKAEGCSFLTLSQTLKQQLALAQIAAARAALAATAKSAAAAPSLTQASLADYLGYSDEQAFAKAFKRWTGMSFTAYLQR
ncbi:MULTISPECIES: AraC family transcriptional regulator [Pseudidiomarina]|uniref:AraC family transcriptional regulator n=2 Tax=Pseudidiomarina TaxID=2800384 RepID=A0A368UNM6_9GAMM|nr:MULTISPECIES: AraC family transcriptional regulator [Pseudidiomarina]PWW07878.1 AraC family transcriptional regulator [Pseudidiomarina maritima]RBP86835.1 AraC family transcriptional regulator [Pseudidiomarina tainanensis]RCW29004.1 AraC family transcriptional regulator [Pseudidiomarina tainanensis]